MAVVVVMAVGEPDAGIEVQAPVEVPVPAPTPVVVEAPSAAERMKGKLGVGFFGTTSLSFVDVSGAAGAVNMAIPLLGARFWTPLSFGPVKRLGVDLAGGVWVLQTGFDATGTTAMPAIETTQRGLAVHVAVPFVFGGGEHAMVYLSPEFRHAALDLVPNYPEGTPLQNRAERIPGATATDLGLRAGAEFFFGFIGLPNLSVEASVLVGMRWRESRQYPGGFLFATRAFSVNTSLINSPWEIFTSSVFAKYYF